jgi:hypothetical protein
MVYYNISVTVRAYKGKILISAIAELAKAV